MTHPSDHKYVAPLKKSLYGLKQSPKLWNDTSRRAMNEFGFRDAEYTPGLYVAPDGPQWSVRTLTTVLLLQSLLRYWTRSPI